MKAWTQLQHVIESLMAMAISVPLILIDVAPCRGWLNAILEACCCQLSLQLQTSSLLLLPPLLLPVPAQSQARQAGGDVVTLLGNHELMNIMVGSEATVGLTRSPVSYHQGQCWQGTQAEWLLQAWCGGWRSAGCTVAGGS